MRVEILKYFKNLKLDEKYSKITELVEFVKPKNIETLLIHSGEKWIKRVLTEFNETDNIDWKRAKENRL